MLEMMSQVNSTVQLFDVASALQEQLAKLVVSSNTLWRFVEELQGLGPLFLFGGAIRDTFHSMLYEDVEISDFDFVLDSDVLPCGDNIERNSFGGCKTFLADGTKVDVWLLKDTYAFKVGQFQKEYGQLPNTAVFSINACIYNVANGEFVESGFFESILERRISFTCTDYLYDFPELQAIRVFNYVSKLKYDLDAEVEGFVRNVVSSQSMDSFLANLNKSSKRYDVENIGRLYRQYS
ncbi:hypothetical protein [Maridesulfovibrio sp.]|uniref:hypothetical protein n=1 Tax=Maridesulfovibrio sp. TaxID=2795000 RepID=UPI002A18CFD9|nr:hypothetical protein [Maridesulfovibrio sp.]